MFSVERLMEFPTHLGQDVEITVRPTRKEHGKVPLSGRLDPESFPHRHPRGTRVSADEEVVSAVDSIRRLHA